MRIKPLVRDIDVNVLPAAHPNRQVPKCLDNALPNAWASRSLSENAINTPICRNPPSARRSRPKSVAAEPGRVIGYLGAGRAKATIFLPCVRGIRHN